MKRFAPRLTYANVVATLALFIALGSASAFAATKLAKNSVGTKQIKNGSITEAKIKNGAIGGAKVNLASLGAVPKATHAASADAATNSSQLGGIPASGYQGKVMWARFLGNGTIVAQSGGISLEANPSAGAYFLNFPGPVAGHGVLTTPTGNPAQVGENLTVFDRPCGTAPDAVKCLHGGDTGDDLYVGTFSEAIAVNAPFSVAVVP
jgi:hypothetical protein